MALAIYVPPAQAQTYTVLHSFTDGPDGSFPYGGLVSDAAGNLYGTTCGAPCMEGARSNGAVFRVSQKSSGWLFTPLYSFKGGNDGAGPTGNLLVGPDGSLYGTTFAGGGTGCGGGGCGTVFRLRPPPSIPPNLFGNWSETVLYRFQGGTDGDNPEMSALLMDQAGNLYGTTYAGGPYNWGTVFKLSPSQGGWTETVLYSFSGASDGAGPLGGLSWLCGGSTLVGTTYLGGGGMGTIFQLAPSGSGWTETVLHSFEGGSDGANPAGGVISDCAIIGTTCSQGRNGGGTAFILNNDLFHVDFAGYQTIGGPWAQLSVGDDGILFGTTYMDGRYQAGNVFNLDGCAGWGYNSIYDFTGGQDGGYPVSNIVLVPNGSGNNLFGTTVGGGAQGYGVVFEIGVNYQDHPTCSLRLSKPR